MKKETAGRRERFKAFCGKKPGRQKQGGWRGNQNIIFKLERDNDGTGNGFKILSEDEENENEVGSKR